MLDYLLHNSYLDTARAFARDTAAIAPKQGDKERLPNAAPQSVEGAGEDGDRIMNDGGDVSGASSESEGLSEDVLRLAGLRRGTLFSS